MDILFEFGSEVVIVRIRNNNVTFANSSVGLEVFVPIEKLQLSRAGILKEFPDLKDLDEGDLKLEAIDRFKAKVNSFNSEMDIATYIISDLKLHGYKCKRIKREGFRAIKY